MEQRVTERTTELEQSRQQAEQERLVALKASQAKSALLTNVSHELRTPLNAIVGFSDMLNLLHSGELDSIEADYLKPREAEYVRDIYESGQHLLRLINEMLDLSKIEAGRIELNIELIDLEELAKASLTFVRHHAQERDITLRYSINSVITLNADGQRMKQILVNLLSNAVKFTPQGGEVSLRISGTKSVVQLEVGDTGIGISPADREHIFEPFFRVTNDDIATIQGTGLGLALCKQLVDLHEGTISVTSNEQGGSIFTIVIPNQGDNSDSEYFNH